jgi:hypothetical protein
MSDLFTLEELDADGALQETAAKVDSHTRSAFLRQPGIGIGAIAGGGARRVTSEPVSVDYRLLSHFEASHERLEKARRALPERWRTDPRPEAKIINDHWIRVIARAAEQAQRIANRPPIGPSDALKRGGTTAGRALGLGHHRSETARTTSRRDQVEATNQSESRLVPFAIKARIPIATLRDTLMQFPTFGEALNYAIDDLQHHAHGRAARRLASPT